MRTKNSFINTLTSTFSLAIISILGFVLSKYFIETFGVEYNGVNGTFKNILAILSITELGFSGAITFNLYKPIVEKDYKKINAIMYFYKKCYRIIGLIIFVLALFTSIFIKLFLKDTSFGIGYLRIIFILFAINTCISYLFSYKRNLFYAYEKNYYINIVDFATQIIRIGLQLVAILVFKSYILYLIIIILHTFITNLILYLLSKKVFKKIVNTKEYEDKEVNKEVMGYVKAYAKIQLLSTSINFTDSLIISSFINVVTAGLYANYNMLFTQINSFVSSFFHNIGASIGNLIAEDNKERIHSINVNLQYLSFFIASFCFICFANLTQPFITIWIGKKYLLPYSILIILSINFYLSVTRQTINYFIAGKGMYDDIVVPMIIESVTNIIVSIVLVLKIGLMGVFIGTLVSSIIGLILTSIKLNGSLKENKWIYFKRQIVFVIITLFEYAIIIGIKSLYLPFNAWLKLIYIFVLCLIVPNIISGIIIMKNKKIEYLKGLFEKIFRKVIRYEKN